MTMSIFAETIASAIADYRLYLRKSKKIDQATRVAKLKQLGLKDVTIYSGDVMLYDTAHAILADISETIEMPEEGYYSYSGIVKYYQYLSQFLQDYDIEIVKDEKVVIHRAQRASRAILDAIQLVNGKPAHVLTDHIKRKMYTCQDNILRYGTDEQFEIYRNHLDQLKPNAPLFYIDLLRYFDTHLQEVREAA